MCEGLTLSTGLYLAMHHDIASISSSEQGSLGTVTSNNTSHEANHTIVR